MPELDLDAIEARAAAATPGPWEIFRYRTGGGRIHLGGDDGRPRTLIADMHGDPESIATAYNEDDREFLFHAREDVPALVAEARSLRAENEKWRERLNEHVDCEHRAAAELRKLHAENAELRELLGGDWIKVRAERDDLRAEMFAARARAVAAERHLAAARAAIGPVCEINDCDECGREDALIVWVSDDEEGQCIQCNRKDRDALWYRWDAAVRQLAAVHEAMGGAVIIKRSRLEGWWDTPPLTGADWRAFAESLPAGEYATTLLYVADAMDAPPLSAEGGESNG